MANTHLLSKKPNFAGSTNKISSKRNIVYLVLSGIKVQTVSPLPSFSLNPNPKSTPSYIRRTRPLLCADCLLLYGWHSRKGVTSVQNVPM